MLLSFQSELPGIFIALDNSLMCDMLMGAKVGSGPTLKGVLPIWSFIPVLRHLHVQAGISQIKYLCVKTHKGFL